MINTFNYIRVNKIIRNLLYIDIIYTINDLTEIFLDTVYTSLT